jgi:hypothetical protein
LPPEQRIQVQPVLDIEDPDPRGFSEYPNPPLTRSVPTVQMEYAQDEFRSQADRPLLRESRDIERNDGAPTAGGGHAADMKQYAKQNRER